MLWTSLGGLLSLASVGTAQHAKRNNDNSNYHPPKPTSCKPSNPPNTYPPGYTFTPTATTYGLGGPIRPTTATQTFEPLDWSTVIIPEIPTVPIDAALPQCNSNSTLHHSNATTPNDNGTANTNPNHKRATLHARAGPGAANPTSIDWRTRFGWNWLTTIQDQKGCGSCWAMAATALVESMVRIEHGIWSKRSEADLHDQIGVSCATGGDPNYALDFALDQGGGLADTQCYEWIGGDRMYYPCGDRSGRSVRLGGRYTAVAGVEDQKRWLDRVGPLSACFTFYPDFYGWNFTTAGTGNPYEWDGVTNATGGHCVLIVGYDDAVGGWLFRNSWGAGWGDKGYGYFKYGVAGIDAWPKTGVTNINPDPWSKKSHHNGIMYESGNGAWHRNFELVRANATGSLTQAWRQGEPPYRWALVEPREIIAKTDDGKGILGGQSVYGQPVLTGSSFNRDFELVYVNTVGNLVSWHFSQSAQGWFYLGMSPFSGLEGYPGFTQLDDSSFSVVVRTNQGALQEYIRDAKTGRWVTGNQVAAPGLIRASGPSLVSSNINLDIYDSTTGGNLYVVAVLNTGRMQLFYRETGSRATTTTWQATEIFGGNVGVSPPVMIQDYWRTVDETTPTGFQLLVAVNGRVQHWQRINTWIRSSPPLSGGNQWDHVWTFGDGVKHVWSLVQGSYRGQLDAVVEDFGGNMWHWVFSGSPGSWRLVAQVPGVAGGF